MGGKAQISKAHNHAVKVLVIRFSAFADYFPHPASLNSDPDPSVRYLPGPYQLWGENVAPPLFFIFKTLQVII
jgi:hypothetical protein